MFGFELWAGFGAFRDPLTITQNMSLSIPPKTTIGGMLAAVIGKDYMDCFGDPAFFSFGYSLILLNPVRKKSFSQNYIEDYTKKSTLRLDAMLKVRNKAEKDWIKKSSERYPKSKPIFRELLINPSFLVFIHNFKFETDIVECMRNHESAYPLYMGNSEFAANYRYVECVACEPKQIKELISFTGSPDKILFEQGKKYTSVYAATRTVGQREYRDFRHVVVCDGPIRLTDTIEGYEITTESGRYGCDFI